MTFLGLSLILGVGVFYDIVPHRFRIKERYQTKQPNILFILADDLGWNQVGKMFTSNVRYLGCPIIYRDIFHNAILFIDTSNNT